MRVRWLGSVVAAISILAAACGSTTPTGAPSAAATAVVTDAPPASPAASQAALATPASSGIFSGQPYQLELPAGWQGFDLKGEAGQAALQQFQKDNPSMAAAITAFQSLPGAVFASNPLLGNTLVAFSLPTGGTSLDLLAQSFSAQFAAVPNLVSDPKPENVTLPGGQAVHWNIVIEVNSGENKLQVKESLYLLANDTTAVVVEFVSLGDAPIPQEGQIMQSFRFEP